MSRDFIAEQPKVWSEQRKSKIRELIGDVQPDVLKSRD